MKTAVIEPTGTLYGCVRDMRHWQDRLLIDIKRGLEGTGGDFRVKEKFVAQAKRASKIEFEDYDDLFKEVDEANDNDSFSTIEDDVNFNAKTKLAIQYHKKGLVHALYYRDGVPAGVFEVRDRLHSSHYVSTETCEILFSPRQSLQ